MTTPRMQASARGEWYAWPCAVAVAVAVTVRRAAAGEAQRGNVAVTPSRFSGKFFDNARRAGRLSYHTIVLCAVLLYSANFFINHIQYFMCCCIVTYGAIVVCCTVASIFHRTSRKYLM